MLSRKVAVGDVVDDSDLALRVDLEDDDHVEHVCRHGCASWHMAEHFAPRRLLQEKETRGERREERGERREERGERREERGERRERERERERSMRGASEAGGLTSDRGDEERQRMRRGEERRGETTVHALNQARPLLHPPRAPPGWPSLR